jgi:hypothetical protein
MFTLSVPIGTLLGSRFDSDHRHDLPVGKTANFPRFPRFPAVDRQQFGGKLTAKGKHIEV